LWGDVALDDGKVFPTAEGGCFVIVWTPGCTKSKEEICDEVCGRDGGNTFFLNVPGWWVDSSNFESID